MKKFSKRTIDNLKGVDPILVIIVATAIERGDVDFTVIDGLRTVEDQQKHYKNGKSKCDGIFKKSYHQSGKAIDFIPYPFAGWHDTKSFEKVGKELEKIAEELGVSCAYGGDWSMKDYPHFEIR